MMTSLVCWALECGSIGAYIIKYTWFSFISTFHSLSLERKPHFSLIQQSEHLYIPCSWMNELKQYAISYFSWLLWKSLASNVRLTFGFLQPEMICRMRFTTVAWCWQHRDCVFKAAGSVLQSCAPISYSCSSSCHILLTLTRHPPKGSATWLSHDLDADLKANIALCSAFNIVFKTSALFLLPPPRWVRASRSRMQPLGPFQKHTDMGRSALAGMWMMCWFRIYGCPSPPCSPWEGVLSSLLLF